MSKFNILKRTPSNPKPAVQKLFGVALEQLVERQGSAIPELVYQCVKSLEKGIDTAGLFNTAGKKVKVQLFKKQAEDGADLSWLGKSKDYHEVTELLKTFFSDMPEPLLTFKLYDAFISISRLENGEAKLQRVHSSINSLPPPNKVILTYLITFFRKCLEHKKNLVSPVVLGKYFGSSFLHARGDTPTQELTLIASLFAYIIEEYQTLMKMPSKPPESPQAASAPITPALTNQATPTPNSAIPNGTTPNTATSTPATARSTTSSSTKTPRSMASPRATSSSSPQTTPRSSPTFNKPGTATTAKKTTTTPATPATTTTTTPPSTNNSTPITTTTTTTTTTAAANKRASTTASASPASGSVRNTAQNIHQMQQQQLHSRLSQIQIIKQQREALKVDQQQKDKEQQQKDKEQQEKEQREKDQKEKEQREKEQQEKEQKEKEKEKETKKSDKSDPANRRLQRPALLRMKVIYDFDARDNTEITIREGGLVDVVSKDESGWWWGRIVNGESKVGLFPANYCEVVETFSPVTRKFSISQLNLNPKIRDLQKECGFVKEDGTTSSVPASPSAQTSPIQAPQFDSPTKELQSPPSQEPQVILQASSSSSSSKLSPRKKKASLRILDLQKSMSSLKGFPGSPDSNSPPQSPSIASPPRSPTYSTSSLSSTASFGNKLSPSSSRGSEGNKLTPSQSFTKSPTASESQRLAPSQSFTKSPSGESVKVVKSTSFGKGATAASEGYKLVPSKSFSKNEEEKHKLAPSNSFSKGEGNGLAAKRTTPPAGAKRKLKTRQERKSQTIEELQNMMQNMRGFPATPEAVRQRQPRDSEPSFTLQKSTSKSRVPSSRIVENANERFSPSSKVMDRLNFEDEMHEEMERPSTPLNHLTKKRAKPTKRRPASIGSLRKISQSVRTLETAEAVQETLQMLDEEVQKRQEMEALAHTFKQEYEQEKKLRNQLEDESIYSSNLFDKIKEELEQQNHTVNMLRYEKDALESMTRQLKRESMDAVNKYEEIQVSKNSLLKELEEMRRKMDEMVSERDSMERERDKYKREASGLSEDLKALESRSRLDKSNTLEELSVAQKQALELQGQVITHQKAKAEVQTQLDQALKELEQARERESKFISSAQGERAELERLRGAEIEKLNTMKHLEEQKATLEAKVNSLKESCKEEQILRKKYFNMLEDMKGKIRVMCRTRPISDKELASGQKMACEFVDPFSITVSASNQTKAFNFDRVFEPTTSQEEVFSDTSHLVQSALDGYNVCIFAYGQTGSGKTHTLLGSDSQPGVCPRAMAHLFECIKRDESRFKVSVRCYLLELYNDNLVDLLLKKDEKPVKLVIKKDSKGMVYVENVTLRKASTGEKLRAFLQQGLKHRHTGATKMNDQSSRSHLIFSMLIKSKNLQTKQHSVGKLSFVDLAGSERAARSGATDERLKEAMSINKSLSALGNVINALSTGEAFVPYRNNKLTQLMSDSIGGNAKTLMMVNVAPGDANADESLQSLAYGQRAKLITNTATKMVESAEVQRLKKIIAQLKSEKGETIEQDEVLDVASEPNGADEDPQSSEDE